MFRITTAIASLAFQLLLCSPLYSQNQEVKTDYEWGKVEDGMKVGVWQYYDKPGELALRVNYTSGNVLFLARNYASYWLFRDSSWISVVPATAARYIGSMHEVGS